MTTEAPSDDPFYTVTGDSIYGTYIPANAGSGSNSSSGSGPGSVVAETSGGLTINLLFDAAAMAAPASFRAGIEQAAAILASTITDKITVNLNIDYSGTGGGAAAGPDSGLFENYSTIRFDLVNNAMPGDTTFNALPNSSSVQGQSNVAVWNAQLKLWGILGANDTTTDDGSATFATDISPNLLVGVALHELTHAMGRVPYGPQPDVFDLYRFTSAATMLFSGTSTAPPAYFSLDGGHTKLADFGQTSDPSDFLNSGVQGANDPFNEYYEASTIQSLSAVDKQMLDALGFHLVAPGKPDLSEYIVVNTTSLGAGGAVTIDTYDMNLGNGASGGSTARIYLSTDPTITTSDTVLATVTTTGSLATVGQPGFSDHQTVTVDLPANLAPGTYYIGGIADYNNQVSESNETNNTYNVVRITVAGVAQPDLSEYVAVNNSVVSAGGSVTIDAYDMNIGYGVSAGSAARIYLSSDPTITTSDTVLATLTTTGPLTSVGLAGYYDHQTVTVNLPSNLAPGTYYIGGIADYNNQVSETNEANNTYNVVQVTVTKPDLSEYVTVDHTTVAAGGSVTIDAYDMNLGNAVSPGSTAQIYLSTDPTITTSDSVLATLTTSGQVAAYGQNGWYDHQAVTVNLLGNLAPGTYYIGGIADYNNQVSETNEANNTYNVVQITVTPPAQPDLSEYVTVDHTTVAAGGSVTIDAYDMNLGNAVSPGSTAQIYLSRDPTITTSDSVLAALTTSGQVAAYGQNGWYDHQAVTVNLPGNLAPGTYYIGGIADYNNHISESNETNNTYNVAQITVTAAAQPDLSEYITVNHSTVAAGGSITIDAYDMNLGDAVSPGSTAQIYLSTNPTISTSDSVLATLTTSEQVATYGQNGWYDHQAVTLNLPGNLAPGTYYIGGIADYNNQISESNESNNTYNVVQITVSAASAQAGAAPAMLTSSAASQASVSTVDSFVFSFPESTTPGGSVASTQETFEFDRAAAQTAFSQLAHLFSAPADEGAFLMQVASGDHDAAAHFASLEGTSAVNVHVIQTAHGFIIQ